MFGCEDVVKTHDELVGRGVEFPQSPVKQQFGWWAMCNDSEGNRFALEQADRTM